MRRIKKRISWLLVALWMLLIFWFSHQPATASSELSSGITQVILNVIEKVTPGKVFDIGWFHHFVRKNAHFFVYLILGILVANGLKSSEIKGYKSINLRILICVAYAISDEVHQLFILGRAGQVKDVLIDSSGAVVGIGIKKLITIYILKLK